MNRKEEDLRYLLKRVPVLKLPASKLQPSLVALTSAVGERRDQVVRLILRDVYYPHFNEKRAFRALVAPTLTRLHFARSEPPLYFRMAPNARIWKVLDQTTRPKYTAIVLFDFATVRLQLSMQIIPPAASLRVAANPFGPRMVDRVRGLSAMLTFFSDLYLNDSQGVRVAEVDGYANREKELDALIKSTLALGRIVSIEEARYLLMKKLLSDDVLASSFVVDEWIKKAIRRETLIAFRGDYAKLDSLLIGGYAINAVKITGGDSLMPTVADYFKESPFLRYAGKLSPESGKPDFVPLSVHLELKSQTEDRFLNRPVTVRLVVSGPGGGKTWTLSWLYREFSDSPDTFVIGIPRVESRGKPERGLVEAIFRSVSPNLPKLKKWLASARNSFPPELEGTPADYVRVALAKPEVYQLLCGGGGRLPSLDGIVAPQLTRTEGTLNLFLGLLRVLHLAGWARVLVMVDEVESLFSVYGRRDLVILLDWIRNIIDECQSDMGRSLPKLEMLLSGTTAVLERVHPGLVGRQADQTDAAMGLIRRLDVPFQLTIEKNEDVLRVASYRIGIHRRAKSNEPFIPYDEKAILYVWKNSFGNLGDYCERLQRMYEIALSEKAARITMSHARLVVGQHETDLTLEESLGETPD